MSLEGRAMVVEDHPLYRDWHEALKRVREALEHLENADEADRTLAHLDSMKAVAAYNAIAEQL
jgi:hypothetical protein